jgi:hypothetical protein
VLALAGVVGIVLAVTGASDDAAALLLAASGLFSISALTFATGPKRRVAKRELSYPDDKKVAAGEELPRTEWQKDAEGNELRRNEDYAEQRGLYFQALVLGKDGRWSTSKVQLLAWTYAVVFGLLALIIAKWLGDAGGWDQLVNHDLQEEYLILLGGPFAAAVLAKAITTQKVENGTTQKTDAEPSTDPVQGLGEVVSDDNGRTDLGDLQYFLFNLVALVYFLGTLIFNLDDGFPDLPGLLVGLTSVSAAGYVSKKAADRAVPTLTSVLPPKARPEEHVDVWGQNLVIELAGSVDRLPHVLIDNKRATVSVVRDGLAGNDHLNVTVPPDAKPGRPKPLIVVTAAGVAPDKPLDFEVLPRSRAKPG